LSATIALLTVLGKANRGREQKAVEAERGQKHAFISSEHHRAPGLAAAIAAMVTMEEAGADGGGNALRRLIIGKLLATAGAR
jgi:hypothetical protein